jgi:3-methyladenine DNA glycosylase AlkC
MKNILSSILENAYNNKSQKKNLKNLKRDDPKKVLRFFKKWHEISQNSKTLFN